MNEQESFWSGKFGIDYINRNQSKDLKISNKVFFEKIFKNISSISTLIEFGANVGMNLEAIKSIYPKIKMHAVEINKEASDILRKKNICSVTHSSILSYSENIKFDVSMVKGVLIHINPIELKNVYKILYNSSDKYILIAEYYNRKPIELDYRGHKNKLFKRDFAGEIMAQFSDLELIDYGFVYYNDKYAPQDDITWFLLKKQK